MITSEPKSEFPSPGWVPEPDLIAKWANQFFSGQLGAGIAPVADPGTGPEPLVAVPLETAALARIAAEFPAEARIPGLTAVPEPENPAPFSRELAFSGFDFSHFSFPKIPALPSGSKEAGLKTDQGPNVAEGIPSAVPGLDRPFEREAVQVDREIQGESSKSPAQETAFDAYSFVPVTFSDDPVAGGNPAFDAAWFKKDFPILQKPVNGKPLIWLDNAATTQKPQQVVDRLSYFYENENSNVHRAAHTLAARATDAYEGAREKVRRFLGASSAREIVFVRGATEAINLVAKAWGWQNIGEGDEILITHLEHHANIVPWQQLVDEKKARLKVAPVDDQGRVILSEYEKLFSPRTKLVSFTQVSNALGTVTPAEELVKIAHRNGAKVLVDGAQAVSHQKVDVSILDADFYVFSGHKVFGPTGIGVLFGKEKILNSMPPWQGGGNMIADVTLDRTLYQAAPARFEAGTGNIADAVGLGAALDYLDRVGLWNVARYEHELLEYGASLLKRVPGLRIIGTAPEKAGVLSFVIDGHKNEEISAALNREGIAVRAGHHCAQPILRRFGLEGTVRASLAFYNLPEDLEALARVLCDLTGKGFGRF